MTKYTKICPRCTSTDIHVDFSNPVVWNFGGPAKYYCKKCGYLSTIFPEVEIKKIKEFQLKQKPKKKTNLVDYQTGYTVGIFEIFLFLIGFGHMLLNRGNYFGIIFIAIAIYIIVNKIRNKTTLH